MHTSFREVNVVSSRNDWTALKSCIQVMFPLKYSSSPSTMLNVVSDCPIEIYLSCINTIKG